ncbi:MAG: TetR/AcrR family transcriptional regulator [Ectothiorhodospiraceae bacterium]|nr:TetR/AcrR family transcriptional regulator [Ectothiorhodospiraceae bacterium]
MTANDDAARGNGRRAAKEKEQLSRDAWLDAAATAIEEGGFDNVRVLNLAKKLGVTRGSFYWHFRDHQDLVVSFLQRWRERRLSDLKAWLPSDTDVESETRRILHRLLSEGTHNVRRMRIELAVRDYARKDPLAADIVAEIDQARIAQNQMILERIVENPRGADDLSLLLYVATMGAQLVMTGPSRKSPAMQRIETMLGNLVLDWHRRGGGNLLEP